MQGGQAVSASSEEECQEERDAIDAIARLVECDPEMAASAPCSIGTMQQNTAPSAEVPVEPSADSDTLHARPRKTRKKAAEPDLISRAARYEESQKNGTLTVTYEGMRVLRAQDLKRVAVHLRQALEDGKHRMKIPTLYSAECKDIATFVSFCEQAWDLVWQRVTKTIAGKPRSE